MTGKYSRALLTFHHILSSRKKSILQKTAKDLNLSGICKVGYPGVLAIEGAEQPVRQYVQEIKALRWKVCTLMTLSTGLQEHECKLLLPSDKQVGVLLVDKMCDIGSHMKEAGLERWWRQGMGYSRDREV